MTTEEKYKLAKWAMNQALKNGAQQAAVSISNGISNSVEIREEKIDKLEQANQSNLSIRLFVDGKYSAHSTSRLKQEELGRFIEEAIESTRYLSEDPFRSLPDPSLYYKGDGPDLDSADESYGTLDPKEKINLAFEAEKEILGKDERLISVSSGYYDGKSERVMVTSNGFEGDSQNTYYGIYCSVSVKGEGDARPEASWNESAIKYANLKKEGIGKIALQKAIKKIGASKVKSGTMPMLVENRVVGRILGPLVNALSGASIQQKNSFLVDKLNEKVLSDKLTLIDDPFIKGGRGSRLFDSEGLATKKRNIFEKGVLKTYFIDTYYAKKLEMSPTSGSTTNLVFETGEKDLEGLISSVEKGIMVTGFNGGNCNGSTGDFSYGIEGFLIENGKITQPVVEMNITGNMLNLWADISEIGNDVRTDSSWRCPSILFSKVDFSGL